MSEAILPAQSPVGLGKFGFRVGQQVQIAFGVPSHGGKVGYVKGFGNNDIAVTLGEGEPGGEPVTVWFNHQSVEAL